ncbi:glycosyl transferase family 2 [Paenibacillus curdlanolyticus YK9]|uniref:Glycosyl transferase family 2 n=1 Tax=Paenibacillus curdlanolyticus YK9 TaxID=717606 RepID=E0IEU0_9BACL|nr:glycosyltransferase family 2 protein [Paenibacillus curdlanolyticus]EFM09178.1 glycosyl transferase family 2 [Paenibacillus curdlanolyticus YK9]
MAAHTKLISLCMIVKNEAACIARCLRSAIGTADEFIVVDTGSTDETIAIARSFGAKIIEAEWRGDFAAARNVGLEQATGEWILFLDADEELSAGAAQELRTLVQSQASPGILLPIWNLLGEEEETATINPVLRLFRNDPRHRFEGRIHEQIAASILRAAPDAQLRLGETVIRHYGYRPSTVAEKDKIERNTRLLLQAIEEEPEQPFHRFNLGVEYLRAGRPAEALASFRSAKGAASFERLSYAHLVFKYEVRSLQTLGAWQEAAAAAREGAKLFADYADLWHCLAESLCSAGRWREAISGACSALRAGPPTGVYHTEDGMGAHRTAFLLGSLYERGGRVDAAVHWYVESVRMKPSLLPPLLRLCRLLRVNGRGDELPALLERRFAFSTEEGSLKIASLLLDSRCYAEAVQWLRQRAAGPCWGEASAAWLMLAEAELAASEGRFAQARRWAAKALDDGHGYWHEPEPEPGHGHGLGQADGEMPVWLGGRHPEQGSPLGEVTKPGVEKSQTQASEYAKDRRQSYSMGEAKCRLRLLYAAVLQITEGAEAAAAFCQGYGADVRGSLAQELAACVAGILREEKAEQAASSGASGDRLARVLQAVGESIRHGSDEAAHGGVEGLAAWADARLEQLEQSLQSRSAGATVQRVLRSARLRLAGCEGEA